MKNALVVLAFASILAACSTPEPEVEITDGVIDTVTVGTVQVDTVVVDSTVVE